MPTSTDSTDVAANSQSGSTYNRSLVDRLIPPHSTSMLAVPTNGVKDVKWIEAMHKKLNNVHDVIAENKDRDAAARDDLQELFDLAPPSATNAFMRKHQLQDTDSPTDPKRARIAPTDAAQNQAASPNQLPSRQSQSTQINGTRRKRRAVKVAISRSKARGVNKPKRETIIRADKNAET